MQSPGGPGPGIQLLCQCAQKCNEIWFLCRYPWSVTRTQENIRLISPINGRPDCDLPCSSRGRRRGLQERSDRSRWEHSSPCGAGQGQVLIHVQILFTFFTFYLLSSPSSSSMCQFSPPYVNHFEDEVRPLYISITCFVKLLTEISQVYIFEFPANPISETNITINNLDGPSSLSLSLSQ